MPYLEDIFAIMGIERMDMFCRCPFHAAGFFPSAIDSSQLIMFVPVLDGYR